MSILHGVRRSLALNLRGLANLSSGPRRGPRVFCVGAAKTGTHTIGEMFADRLRAAHEMDSERLIRLILDPGSDSAARRRYLLGRDRWRRLQIDASQVNIYLVDDLEALFPDSRYVLTVRQPALWLRSMLDDSLRRETSATWHQFRDFRFGAKALGNAQEQPLAEAGLYRLDGYLGYWRFAARQILDRIPADRRLIVPTEQISGRAAEIARFCLVPDPDRPPAVTHAFRNSFRSGVLGRLDRAYLADRLEALAGDTARQLFPGWSADQDLARALES